MKKMGKREPALGAPSGGGGGVGRGAPSHPQVNVAGRQRGGGGSWTAKTVKRPPQQPAHPRYANYWAPLTRKRHIPPHSAQPRHTNYWAPRTRKRHQQEHRPQRPTKCSDPTQHAKGRAGDCPGPRKGTTTRRNVTQGVAVKGAPPPSNFSGALGETKWLRHSPTSVPSFARARGSVVPCRPSQPLTRPALLC